jgi:tetratricopeptide (TPR) repeat protein
MKRTLLAAMTIVLLASGLLLAQAQEANDAYIKAMTAQAPAQKAQMLKDFLAKYAGKGSEYENFASANLAMLAYPGKQPSETITYGEKALQLGGLDDLTKYQVMIIVAGVCVQAGQNLDKAKSLALQAVEVSKAAKGKEGEDASKWNQLAGAAYFVEGQAREKTRDYKGAAESYATSYGILKNPQILASLKKLGKTLYDAKAFAEAEKVFQVVASTTKDPEITMLYAGALFKSGKADEALTVYKEIYAKQKNGDVAYNIGIILAKKAQTQASVAGDAINYLLDASFLSPANSKQAMGMAESLFFTTYKEFKWNETVTQINALSKKIEDMTKSYNDKFGDKDEGDLSDAQKKEMKDVLAGIEGEKKNLERLKDSQNIALNKFNAQIDETKKRLGIR